MSMYRVAELECPQCKQRSDARVYDSVNGDRRPDLREAILDDSLMRMPCPSCGESLRVKPRFVYFDQELGLWVNVRPVGEIEQWAEAEEQTLAAFVQAFGPFTAPLIQQVGAAMQARVAFGWAGLRETLLCARYGLDKAALEALKVTLMHDTRGELVDDAAQLRLMEVDEARLVLGWLGGSQEILMAAFEAPRARLDALTGEDWAPLRAAVTGDCFIDMHRSLSAEEALGA